MEWLIPDVQAAIPRTRTPGRHVQIGNYRATAQEIADPSGEVNRPEAA